MTEEVNFDSLNMKISDLVKRYPSEQQKDIFEYLNRMDEHDKKAYDIAYGHLGTSFNIVRSNGFKDWKLVLTFLKELSDEDKVIFNYHNDYSFDHKNIMETQKFKLWLKNRPK